MYHRFRRIPTRLYYRLYKQNRRWGELWGHIQEAVAGTDRDFTTLGLNKAIFLLAIPMVLEMAMESIFAVVDIFFVSRLGADAVATVGITESLMSIVYSLSVGLSAATTAVVARRIGEKNVEGASRAAVQAVICGITVSLLITVPALLFAPRILSLMGGSESMVREHASYTTIMLSANGIIILLFIMNAVFRSSGDAAVSMRVLWLANLVNIVLDPCLIFGWGPFPALGVTGAAVATNLGRGLAIIYQIYLLMSGRNRVRILRRHLKLDLGVIKRLIRLSLGSVSQSLIATSSWVGMVRIIAVFGSSVVAGYTIAIRIIIFTILPSWGLSNAAATLVGQNLGAGKPRRAARAVWQTGIVNMILMGMIALVFFAFPGFFIRLFIADPTVVDGGIACLRIISTGYVTYALGMVVVQAFNGAGDTSTPAFINLFCFWLFEIPLAYILALPAGFRENGVYIAIVVAETLMSVIAAILFKRGRWKDRQI